MELTPVSFMKGSDSLIEGLAIPFGGPVRGKDLEGEAFSAETDFAFDWFPHGRPVIYEHGLDGGVKTFVQGHQTEHDVIDEGVWVRAQLNRSAQYHTAVKRLIDQGALFFSSGTMPHLARVDRGGNIKRWPWVELSLTPTPAHPWAGLHRTKSVDLVEHLAALDLEPSTELLVAAIKSMALDASSSDDADDLPAGSSLADDSDRLLDGASAFRDRLVSLVDLRAKSGRVLSAATRERLSRHPGSLRELADDLDQLLSDADAPKGGKSLLEELRRETERQNARLLGVNL